jgi:hypothetical protein
MGNVGLMDWRATMRASSLAYPLLVGGILLAFMLWAFHAFGRLLLLIEYREWSNASNIGFVLSLFPIKIMQFSRGFGLFTDASLAILFGHNVLLHNGFQICLIAASALLLSLAVRRLFPDAPLLLVGAAMVFLLFSTPILDSLTWQATILDKLCLFFSALATYIVTRLDLVDMRARKIAAVNLGVFAIVVAAYNSKESAFALAPSLLLLVVARTIGSSLNMATLLEGFRKGCKLLALPLLYAVVHVGVVYQSLAFDAGQRAHDTGGNAAFNLYHFFVYLFNLEPIFKRLDLWPYAPQTVLTTFAAVTLVVTAAITVLLLRFGHRPFSVFWIWGLASFLMSYAIYARSAGIPPYYMLVPQFYLTLCLFVAFLAAVQTLKNIASAATAVQAFAVILTVLYVAGFCAWSPDFLRTAAMSDNFTLALRRVKAYLAANPTSQHVTFLWPKSGDWNAYMFIGPSDNHHDLAQYLSDSTSTATLSALNEKISDVPYQTEPKIRLNKNDIVVVLGQQLRLKRIVRGQ